jgi:orotate phosphoribosyltransferase
MVDSIGADNFDAIAGMDVLGIALASPLAHLLKKPLLCLRSEERGEALVWAVEGAARPRWRTLVIVDQAATDKSIGSAVDALRRTGCTVTEAMALVDREEGAKAKLATRGVGLNFFVGIRELAESLFQSRSITKENYGAVIKQTQKTTD